MLTVKLIDPQGQEEIFEVASVSLVCPEFGPTDAQKELHIIHHDGGITIVSSGKVYVMNDNGKTVADYLFSMPPATQPVVGYHK